MNSTTDIGIRLLEKIKKDELFKTERFRLKRKIELYTSAKSSLLTECQGDRELRHLYQTLAKIDKTNWTRSIQQKQFHDYFIAASIRNIYKDDFVKNYPRILKENPQFNDDLNQNVIVTCPRRFGKTIATSMFIAAYLICVEGAEVAVFSPSKRQSVMLLESVDKFIHILGASSRISVRNQEKLFISGTKSYNDIRKSFYYPAVINSLRGVSGKTLILEEMAMLPQQVFYEVILPLMQLSDAYLIGISTIKDESNFMTKYIRQKDQFGESFFKVFQFYGSCEDCRNAGTAFSCCHLDHMKPSWHSSAKTKRIKLIMEGNEELAMQELMGISSSKNKRAFLSADIRKLFLKPSIELPGYIQYVFVSVDPCGSGSSNFAICSAYQKTGELVILGMDAVPCKTVEVAYVSLKNHVDQLKSINQITNEATLVFILENNLGFEAQHLSHFISKNYKKFIIMNQGDNSIGLHTNNKFKVGSALMLKNRLKKEMVSFSKKFFSTARTIEKTLEILEDQLTEYRQIIASSTTHFSRSRMTFSGKNIGSTIAQDDLVISLLLNIYWSEQFYTNPIYNRYHI